MNPIIQLASVGSSIVRSAAEPSHVVSFLAVVVILFLMAVVWRLLPRRQPQRARSHRRR